MRFLIVLALFSIPLVCAGLSGGNGLAAFFNQQRMEELKRQNTSPAHMLRHAELNPSGFSAPAPEPADALNNPLASTFGSAQLTEDDPLEESMKKFAAQEDYSAARISTGTTNSPNPEEIIEGMSGTPGSNGISKAKLTEDGRKLTIFG